MDLLTQVITVYDSLLCEGNRRRYVQISKLIQLLLLQVDVEQWHTSNDDSNQNTPEIPSVEDLADELPMNPVNFINSINPINPIQILPPPIGENLHWRLVYASCQEQEDAYSCGVFTCIVSMHCLFL